MTFRVVTQREGDALVPTSVDRSQGEGGDAFTPPVLPTQGASCSLPAVEGRKSVLELVTDFSSCISGLSSSEGEPDNPAWSGVSTRKHKRVKRKASKSPEQLVSTQ